MMSFVRRGLVLRVVSPTRRKNNMIFKRSRRRIWMGVLMT